MLLEKAKMTLPAGHVLASYVMHYIIYHHVMFSYTRHYNWQMPYFAYLFFYFHIQYYLLLQMYSLYMSCQITLLCSLIV